MKHLEYNEQCALFYWASLESKRRPELALLNASANGEKRDARAGARLKRSGVKAGYPDIFLPVVSYISVESAMSADKFRIITHGLFIELKVGKNKPTPQQLWWHQMLTEQGYKVVVAYGWEQAKDAIVDYLEGKG